MSFIDDLKAKADANGDGKLSKDDLESLKKEDNGSKIEQLKAADQNNDGKISFDDVKNFDLGSTTDNLKNCLNNNQLR